MSDFLETLKVRAQDAQKRMQTAQQKLAAAQAEFQAASQEFGAWNYAVVTEARRLEQANGIPASSWTESATDQPDTSSSITTKTETNKTELIRTFLQQHPTGVTPGDLWEQLKSQIKDRAYLYSVLKRLKDKDEVQVRRGKYYFKHPPEGDRQINVVQ